MVINTKTDEWTMYREEESVATQCSSLNETFTAHPSGVIIETEWKDFKSQRK